MAFLSPKNRNLDGGQLGFLKPKKASLFVLPQFGESTRYNCFLQFLCQAKGGKGPTELPRYQHISGG